MFFIFPAVFLMVGLGLGGGLAYINYRTRGYLRSLDEARSCKAASLVAGPVKVQGVAKAVDPKDLLISPIEQRPCVYYRLVIEQWQSSTYTRGSVLNSRSTTSGSWIPIIEDTQAIPMVIADETGAVPIDPKEAKLDLQSNRRHANLFCGLPKEVEASLRERYKIVTTMAFLPKQMRYTEVVIAQDAEVFVHGECEVTDGKAAFTTRNQPLYLSFRNEEQLRRNGKITEKITLVAAIAAPVLFAALSVWSYVNISSTFGPNNQAAAGKPDASKENPSKANPAKRPGK
jgi:E3 Ubiquitin ligase